MILTMISLTAEYEAQLSGAQEQNEQKIKDIQGKKVVHGYICRIYSHVMLGYT